MDRNLSLDFVRVTENAAIASARWIGAGDNHAADKAATEHMRARLNSIDFKGRIVIGEGERDEAPMLYIGEQVGNGNGAEFDLAVDPLEGTNLVAKGWANALSVLAAGKKGALLHAPDTYMDKIACGPEAKGKIDLDYAPEENIRIVAEALGRKKSEITVAMMDRDRHLELMKKVRAVGAKIRLITDGDVSAALATAMPQHGIDLLLGVGGAPEGVISAAGMKCLGGDFQGRLKYRNGEERKRGEKMGLTEGKKHAMEEIAKGEVLFAATGVTEGFLLDGVKFSARQISTHSLVMRSSSKTVRFVEAHHDSEMQAKFEKSKGIA
ncbi:class II fructose-bisphosphatase [Candidatus Micrarchaeota archaeon]|nr:class II fructose-bisphosphatase [Candidatus Micrarchaeota archaeon]